MDQRIFHCVSCGYDWEIRVGVKKAGRCPNCAGTEVKQEPHERFLDKKGHRGRGRSHSLSKPGEIRHRMGGRF